MQLPQTQFGARAFIKLPENLAEQLKGTEIYQPNAFYVTVNNDGDLFINDGGHAESGSMQRQTMLENLAEKLVRQSFQSGELSTVIDSRFKELKKVIRQAFASTDGVYYPDAQTTEYPMGRV